ncbi:MAG TPA: preprotein translocase subunit YajC [Planctomycetaceae bacterium]|nr:preprotein translocase subunit YajC [Planctomycetaceae bacterium]
MLSFHQLAISALVLLAQTPEATGTPTTADNTGAGGFVTQFLSNPLNLVLFSVMLFMLLVVRPQRTEMKKLQQMLASLKKNDRVVTSGGIHGVVVQANSGDSTVVLRIDENSGARITINRESIARVLTEPGGDGA